MAENTIQPDLKEELHSWQQKGKRNKYYQMLKGENKIQCLKCGKYLSGYRTSNIKRHYKLIHKKEIDIDCEKEESTSEEVDNEEDVESESSAHSQARETAKRAKLKSRIWVNIDKPQFLECCVGLITLPYVPVEIFDDQQFFKPLIEPFERKFGTNLSSRNILPMLEGSTLMIQDRITKSLKHRMVSLKVDVVGGVSGGILGINVAYMKNFRICTETLGVLQLREHRSVEQLKDAILKCLMKYQIESEQIYSKSIDYGLNVMGANSEEQEWNELIFEENIKHMEEDDVDAEIDMKYYKNLHLSLSSILADTECPAYVLEQAANDVLQQLENQLNEIRSALSELCTLTNPTDASVRLPTLSKTSNWCFIYHMMKYLVKIKEHIDDLYSTKIDLQFELNWNFIMEFITAFFPLITSKQRMTGEHYIIGDFYRDWLTCELDLEDLEDVTPFAKILLEAMRERKKSLLTSNTFLAALFLDPRFNFENCFMLTQTQKQAAISHLCKCYQTMKHFEECQRASESFSVGSVEIKSEVTVKTEEPTDCSMIEVQEPCTSGKYAKLDRYILEMMTVKSNASELQRALEHKLLLFACGKTIPLDADVLKYWKSYSFDNELKKLAQVILSVPVTQMSMKRAFTGLTLLETNNKSDLTDEKLNNLLLTKLNFHLLDSSGSEFEWTGN